jgi:hypothetical protein
MWLGHGSDHSPPTSVKVKNLQSYTSITSLIKTEDIIKRLKGKYMIKVELPTSL